MMRPMTLRPFVLCGLLASCLALVACGGTSVEDQSDRGDTRRGRPSWQEPGAVPDQPLPPPVGEPDASVLPDAEVQGGEDASTVSDAATDAAAGDAGTDDAGSSDAAAQF
jgi:hypothetical protein